MLYSIGKDSSVMLHLARRRSSPSPPPFPLVHVDTTWKFSDDVRSSATTRPPRLGHGPDRAPEPGVRRAGASTRSTTARRSTPTCGRPRASSRCIDQHKFDLCFGGARRDEEKSRAKERIFSVRSRAAPVGSRSASGPSCGRSTTPAAARARRCASSRSRTGPSSTCGSTSTSSRSRSCRSTSPRPARSSTATAC